MDRWRLWFYLLLPLSIYIDSQGTVHELIYATRHLQLFWFQCDLLSFHAFSYAKTMTLCCDILVIAGTQLLVKTDGKEPDAIRVCDNYTLDMVTMILCWIKSERIREQCLTYRREHGFKNCDPRFTLRTQNQTVFLHLSTLTSEDSGNYTCQCSNMFGTNTVQLNITVEGK